MTTENREDESEDENEEFVASQKDKEE